MPGCGNVGHPAGSVDAFVGRVVREGAKGIDERQGQ